MKVFRWLLDLLYPPKCVFCGRLLRENETDLCEGCRTSLPTVNESVKRGSFYTGCCCVYYYEGTVRDSVLRYKFRSMRQYADAYGRLLAMRLLRQGETALRRRPERGLLAGLWEYPNVPGFLSEEEVRRTLEQWGLQPVRVYETLPARHIFTHREWSMNGWVVEVSGRGPEDWAWAGGEAFARYAIPSAFSAFCQAAEKRK